jgi:hypothetical protein
MIMNQNAGYSDAVNAETERSGMKRASVASAMDCTGLIPSEVIGEEESENYEELYDILPEKPQTDVYDSNFFRPTQNNRL